MSRIPVDVLTRVADHLGVSVEDLIGVRPKRSTGKRGPAPKLQQQLERIRSPPAAEQRAIVRVLDAVLAAHQSQTNNRFSGKETKCAYSHPLVPADEQILSLSSKVTESALSD